MALLPCWYLQLRSLPTCLVRLGSLGSLLTCQAGCSSACTHWELGSSSPLMAYFDIPHPKLALLNPFAIRSVAQLGLGRGVHIFSPADPLLLLRPALLEASSRLYLPCSVPLASVLGKQLASWLSRAACQSE